MIDAPNTEGPLPETGTSGVGGCVGVGVGTTQTQLVCIVQEALRQKLPLPVL